GIVRSRECARRAICAEPANETSIRRIPIRFSKYTRNQLHRSKHNESRNGPKRLVKPRHGHRGLARPLSDYGWDEWRPEALRYRALTLIHGRGVHEKNLPLARFLLPRVLAG